MPRKPGSAQFTEHLAVAVTPEQKEDLVAEATERGVNYSVAARWAISEWLDRNRSVTGSKTDAPVAS